ncbi:hypothetical protein [Ochrobactrum sp. BTU1]
MSEDMERTELKLKWKKAWLDRVNDFVGHAQISKHPWDVFS